MKIWANLGPSPAFRAELKIWAKFRLSMLRFLPRSLPQPKGLQDSRGRRWPSPAAVCTPHACSDAAEPISRSTRLHSRPPASGSLPTSPVFGICAFPSREHTGIGAHFHVKLIEIWARIRHINETNLGAFPSKLWPAPRYKVVNQQRPRTAT